MDSNATYTYQVSNQIGLPILLIENGFPLLPFALTNEQSYDYARVSTERFEN